MARASANQKVFAGPSSSRRDKEAVPWKEMERRVAEQIAAKAVGKPPPNSARASARTKSGRSDIPPWKQNTPLANPSDPLDADDFLETVVKASTVDEPPKSGVRMGGPDGPDGAARPLTFTVYSVEELDARQRVSVPPPSTPAPRPSRWPEVLKSAKALIRAWRAWYKTPKPRTRMMDVCGVALATLRVDLFAALQELPWRKILVRGGIGLASFGFLLFVVLTAAELTDDLQPSPSRAVASKGEETNALEVKAAEPAEAAEAPAIELDDDATPTAEKKPVVTAKKPAASKKKKKGGDVFSP
jgi:hypothetical protein